MTADLNIRRLPITVGIIGHIDINPTDQERAARTILKLFERIADRYPHTPLRLLSSLAEGADRIAAKAFLAFRDELHAKAPGVANSCELIVPLPLPATLFEDDFPYSVPEFRGLASLASAVFSIPVKHGHTLVDIGSSGPARDAQYQDAGRYIASHCDILVAMWDGIDVTKIGGTSDTVRIRLLNHDAVSRSHAAPLVRPNVNPVFHITVARMGPSAGTGATDTFAHPYYCTSPDSALNLIEELQSMDDFNRAVTAFVSGKLFQRQAGYAIANSELAERVQRSMSFPQKTCLELFATADALAVFFESRWRRMTYIIYGLGLATASILAVAVDGVLLPWSMFSYFIVLAVAAIAYAFMHFARIENRHIESRALAELLRVQFAWLFSGIEDPAHRREKSVAEGSELIVPVTRVLMGQHQGNLGWLVRAFFGMMLYRNPDNEAISVADQQAVVGDWIASQARYFRKSAHIAEKQARTLGLISSILMFSGLLAAFGSIIMTSFHLESFHEVDLEVLHHVLIILSAALPICAVVVENASERFGVEAQARIRARMHDVYETSHTLMSDPSVGSETRERIILETGREAVSEATMWLFLRKIKPVKISM